MTTLCYGAAILAVVGAIVFYVVAIASSEAEVMRGVFARRAKELRNSAQQRAMEELRDRLAAKDKEAQELFAALEAQRAANRRFSTHNVKLNARAREFEKMWLQEKSAAQCMLERAQHAEGKLKKLEAKCG